MLIDTHVHVWPLDDAPGHRPVEGAKVGHPKEAAPVEWLLEDMAEFGVDHCVLVQSSAFGWDNTYMVECLEAYPGSSRRSGWSTRSTRTTPTSSGTG
jgi:predicted TIM-barrel fold metal-dependent hydrolase